MVSPETFATVVVTVFGNRRERVAVAVGEDY